MFGSASNTSTWGQPQQQQQQPQQQGTNAFGQPTNAFGSTGAFGQPAATTSAFGQQQQQPAANPMFGGFGTANNANNTATTSTNNAFGAGTSGTSAFGQPKTTFGGGAFGSGGTTTSAFGGVGGTFGAANNNTAAAPTTFGSTSTGTGAFGATNAFGKTPTNAFGATSTTTGDATAPVTTGSANPAYTAHSEKDGQSTTTLQYQAISCMPAYRGSSFEELRVQDYQQNRKTSAATNTGGFGATSTTSAFGQPANNTTTTGFGTFGQTSTPATNTGGGFGSTFGAQTQQQNTGTTSLFGQTQPQQQQQQPSAFGTFGQQNQTQPAATSAFGQTTNTGAFGQPQAQAPSAFGTFGSTNNTTPSAFGSTGAFGQTQQQGAGTTGAFGQQQPQQQSAFGSAFGANNNQAKPSIFGNTPQTTTTSAFGTGGSLFGQNQQQPQQQGTASAFGQTNTGTPSLFGNTQNQQQPAQQTSIFGQAQPAQNTGSIFGQNNTSAFGQAQPAQQQPSAFGSNNLFAQKPATTSIFGQAQPAATATTQPSTGLFGNNAFGANNAAQPNTTNAFNTGGSIFGGAKPAGSLFGNTQAAAPAAGTSIFGGNQSTLNVSALGAGQQQQQPSLTASVAQPYGANLPIFDLLGPGPKSIVLNPKKKSGLFNLDPARQYYPELQNGYGKQAPTKLRGYSSTMTTTSQSGSFASQKPNVLAISASTAPIGTAEFFNGSASTAALGTGGRSSVKKLVLNKDVSAADVLASIGGVATPGSLKAGGKAPKPSFNAALSIASREKDAAAPAHALSPAPTPAPQEPTEVAPVTNADGLHEGEYYCKPPLDQLRKLGFNHLSAFKDLIVGRVGYGEIHFLEPVNLTEVSRLQDLLGRVVQFNPGDCCIYNDVGPGDRPPPGQGINVRSRISILHSWPMDKATKEPIRDVNHPAMKRHEEKIKKVKDTNFESYDPKEGKWVFTVDSW